MLNFLHQLDKRSNLKVLEIYLRSVYKSKGLVYIPSSVENFVSETITSFDNNKPQSNLKKITVTTVEGMYDSNFFPQFDNFPSLTYLQIPILFTTQTKFKDFLERLPKLEILITLSMPFPQASVSKEEVKIVLGQFPNLTFFER